MSEPKWYEILTQHPKWLDPYGTQGWIETVEAQYRDKVNLEEEALACVTWLNTTPKGKRRKNIPLTFLNWVRKCNKPQAQVVKPKEPVAVDHLEEFRQIRGHLPWESG